MNDVTQMSAEELRRYGQKLETKAQNQVADCLEQLFRLQDGQWVRSGYEFATSKTTLTVNHTGSCTIRYVDLDGMPRLVTMPAGSTYGAFIAIATVLNYLR